jgi:small-conductance mechanosensitive channel
LPDCLQRRSAEAIARLTERIKAILLETPAPAIVIQEFNATGTLIALRVHAPTPNFGQVYNDVQNAIAEVCLQQGWPAPATYQVAVPLAPANARLRLPPTPPARPGRRAAFAAQ